MTDDASNAAPGLGWPGTPQPEAPAHDPAGTPSGLGWPQSGGGMHPKDSSEEDDA